MLDEKQITHFMKALGLSRDEAIELIHEDEKVAKMKDKEVNSDLTAEQRKAQKSATKTGSRKTAYKFDTKEKKKDTEKIEIVAKIFEFVSKFTQNCEISNESKEISFTFGENSYSLTLTKHRKATK